MSGTAVARSVRLGAVSILTLGLGAAALLGAAAPASAAVTVAASAGNGTVGVAQTISATVASTSGATSGTVAFTANGQAIGSGQVGGSAGTKTQISWTPTSAASTVIEAKYTATNGDTASDSDTVTISRVGTAVSITAPSSATTSSKVAIVAVVRSSNGSYVPTGQVAFSLTNGTVIGTAGLDGSGRGSITYTVPSTAGTVTLLATYDGDANATGSKSPNTSIGVTSTTSTVSLVVPQTAYVNTATSLVAKINPATAPGTVEFLVNGKHLNTVTVRSGAATTSWTPGSTGAYAVTAKYSGGGGIGAGTATATIQVITQLKTDQITVDPAGAAGPLVPGVTTTLANGSSVILEAKAASGQAVKLSVVGPCSLTGTVLQVKGVGGACVLTASTSGGNGYAPATAKYTLQTGTGAQTAKVAAPASGTYAKGRKLFLAKKTKKTNLGQPITWRVVDGRSHCKIVASGVWFKVKLTSRGTCTVRGYAPAISDQWAAYRVFRTYTVR